MNRERGLDFTRESATRQHTGPVKTCYDRCVVELYVHTVKICRDKRSRTRTGMRKRPSSRGLTISASSTVEHFPFTINKLAV